jgi:acyl carrier protein
MVIMDREAARQHIEKAVGDWRGNQGGVSVAIGESTRPVTGVEGFDSYSGIVATIQIESDLGITFSCDNIFLSEDGKQARSVGQIIDAILGKTK